MFIASGFNLSLLATRPRVISHVEQWGEICSVLPQPFERTEPGIFDGTLQLANFLSGQCPLHGSSVGMADIESGCGNSSEIKKAPELPGSSRMVDHKVKVSFMKNMRSTNEFTIGSSVP
jgi:hypothetical protein